MDNLIEVSGVSFDISEPQKDDNHWLRLSHRIASKVRDAMNREKMQYKFLSDVSGIPRARIFEITAGHCNITLEEISLLSSSLGIKLLAV